MDVASITSYISSLPMLDRVIILSGIAALLTSLGALAVVFLRPDTHGFDVIVDVGLGFSSGIMLVASFTSLLLPAIDSFGIVLPLVGFILGGVILHVLNNVIPHEHLIKGYEGPPNVARKLKAAWLVALAIIIHNIPEGITIGASTLYSPLLGFKTSIAIGIQDIPEGTAVAVPVALASGSKLKGIAYGVLSGVSEMVSAIAVSLVTFVDPRILLPLSMGFGAGAMIYVVSHESLPESHRGGHEDKATLGFFIGFLLMLLLDTLLA